MALGKTVEINNTDAEGRLVVSDGVVYAKKDLKADIIVDMCTLTGAQGISTGKYHAAHVTNSEDWEQFCSEAGRASADLSFPLVYCPELHFSEFSSAVADMKNSVAVSFLIPHTFFFVLTFINRFRIEAMPNPLVPPFSSMPTWGLTFLEFGFMLIWLILCTR